MPVPDFQSLMLPVLRALASGEDTALRVVRERVATAEGLSAEDVQEMFPSGRQKVFGNRVSWAAIHMMRAGLLERPRRAVFRLTQEGERLLSRNPSRIDMRLLGELPEHSSRSDRSPDEGATENRSDGGAKTPLEALDRAVSQLSSDLQADVLKRVRSVSPEFFERVVVDLLIAMDYGGGDAERGRVTGGSGDGGIDGKIQEDALGLDEIYVQAKRYAEGNAVGAPALQNFAGALDTASTNKGVFITTAGFTRSAKDYVKLSLKQIVLIDGNKLAELMIKYGVGVRTQESHEIKRIDEDYFGEDEE